VNGFYNPKGTVLLGNAYSSHHNPEYLAIPEKFSPERFLFQNGECVKNNPAFMPFGVRRRYCPGETFAMDSLFLFTTSIFQNFYKCKSREEDELVLESKPGFLRLPLPFYVKLEERFESSSPVNLNSFI